MLTNTWTRLDLTCGTLLKAIRPCCCCRCGASEPGWALMTSTIIKPYYCYYDYTYMARPRPPHTAELRSQTYTHTNLEAAHKLYNLWKRASIANTSPMIYGHWSAPWAVAVAARRVPIDKQLGNAMQKQGEPSAKRIGKRKLAQWEPEEGGGPIVLDRHLSCRPAASSVIAERSSGCIARLSVCRFWNLILWIFISFDFALIFNWFAPSISRDSIPLQFF